MMHRRAVLSFLTLMILSPMALSAADTQATDTVYGHELMTPQERAEHRAQMRKLKTEQEREKFRTEHHTRMQERAKEKGVKLPDPPPARGQGMGPGGGGMGPGGGMGQGRGK